jgi:hypothetical protein
VGTLVRLVNDELLERIHRWFVDNSLVLNASKTQVMFISRRDCAFSCCCYGRCDSVKNLGLYNDDRLSWKEQVSRVVFRTFSTLQLLCRFQRYTSRDLRIYLVRYRLLIIPIFLCTDVV